MMKKKISLLIVSLCLVGGAFFIAQNKTAAEPEKNGYEPESQGDLIFSILK